MQELLNCCLRVPRARIESVRKVVPDFLLHRSAVGNVVQHSAMACRVLLVVLRIYARTSDLKYNYDNDGFD